PCNKNFRDVSVIGLSVCDGTSFVRRYRSPSALRRWVFSEERSAGASTAAPRAQAAIAFSVWTRRNSANAASLVTQQPPRRRHWRRTPFTPFSRHRQRVAGEIHLPSLARMISLTGRRLSLA